MNKLNFKERISFAKFLIFSNFLFSVLLGFSYIAISNNSFVGYLFSLCSLISNTSIIYIVVSSISFIFALFPYGHYFLIVFFSFIHLSNIVDIFLYKFWDFHINSMVLNLLTTPGGIETLNQSWNVKLYFSIICVLIISIEIFIFLFSLKIYIKKFKFKKIILLIILFMIIDKFGFAISSLYNYTPVTMTRELFPLYQPLTIREFANKYLGFELKRDLKIDNEKNTALNYPFRPIKLKEVSKKYNIVWLVVDSMRYDMFDKDIMPYTYEFSKKAVVFKNHYSGGNATRFGIFSMFYGLYGNYWFKMVGERRAPVFLDLIKKMDYNIKILATAKLTFPEFTNTCFVNIDKKDIYDEPKGDSLYKRDSNLSDKLIEYVKSRDKSKPFFMFAFFDSTHGAYDYPQELEKFKPSYGVNLLKLDKENIKPLFNKYKNSVYFEDHLIKNIIETIKKEGLIKNTIIIITGDHGEPFLERGYYGHNHSFSREEVSVPLVFYDPDIKPSVIEYKTSHFDLVPTFMKIVGAENNPSDYSHGFGLFEAKWEYLPVFTWDKASLIFDKYSVVFPLSAYGAGLKVYDNKNWQKIEVDSKEYMKYLIDLKERSNHFLKK